MPDSSIHLSVVLLNNKIELNCLRVLILHKYTPKIHDSSVCLQVLSFHKYTHTYRICPAKGTFYKQLFRCLVLQVVPASDCWWCLFILSFFPVFKVQNLPDHVPHQLFKRLYTAHIYPTPQPSHHTTTRRTDPQQWGQLDPLAPCWELKRRPVTGQMNLFLAQ